MTKNRTRLSVRATSVLSVLCAGGFLALIFQGCEKATPSSEQAPESPKTYMNDPSFRTNLVERREAREALQVIHAKLARQMKALVDAKLKALKIERPTEADLARVKAELEKDPEWNSLYKRCEDAAQAIKENRRAAMGVVRERLAPKKEISK